MPEILVTGATGYVGSRLLPRLEEDGRAVRCLARRPDRVSASRASTEVVRGDCLDASSLASALVGIHDAYYLVHSMAAGADFAELDRRAAANFGRAAASAGVRRIIYLGGLVDASATLSTHLQSRVETGDVLREAGVPVIEFRSSIIIGSGSLSFEMIRALVERLPVMVCPRWVETRTQPIAVDDVVAYLAGALDLPEGDGRIVEIGGPEVVSYGDMMRTYARLRGLRRWLVRVPVLTPRLSGIWLSLVTPAQARVGRALVDGLKNATVVQSPEGQAAFGIAAMPLRVAFTKAIEESAAAHLKRDRRSVIVDATPSAAFAPIRRIGGTTGWYFGNVLWQVRGRLDRWLGGVGMSRGRRDPDVCVVDDVIDGWTVEVFEPDRRLRLSADIKLPGRGWLEFQVTPIDGGRRSEIRQTATFDPRGLLGRMYWLAVLPLHLLIFGGLLRQIARRAHGHDPDSSVFVYRSIVPARASEVFRWHERPDALQALIPSASWFRVDERNGGVRDGGRVTCSIGLGSLRLHWDARHFGYIAGTQFCDEQVRGPFATWRHRHRVEPIGTNESLYEDRIEYAVPGGRFVNLVAGPMLRPFLRRAFARRHRIVSERVRTMAHA